MFMIPSQWLASAAHRLRLYAHPRTGDVTFCGLTDSVAIDTALENSCRWRGARCDL